MLYVLHFELAHALVKCESIPLIERIDQQLVLDHHSLIVFLFGIIINDKCFIITCYYANYYF